MEIINVLELKGHRIANGHKQVEVAKILNLSPKTFCFHENSEVCKFSLKQIEIIAKLYKLNIYDVNYIFFDNALPIGNTS